ncbi:TetR/AcrR family transcriptional regulator [Moorella naiadis]|uniref:TetR/AcrR family transcriptional regulator n=1 Tax=Moorella naiadis (nom. illeg.) TaxID=3093670 RepID=UPI003D9CA6F1
MKDRILAAMKRLASQKGFHAVTTDELAAAAGISKRTLYRYFQSKDEIIEQVLETMLQGLLARIEAILAGPQSPPVKLKAAARAVAAEAGFLEPHIFADLQRYYPHLWIKIDRFRSERMGGLGQVYLEGCRQGYFKEFDTAVLLTSYLGAVRAVIDPAFLTSHNISLARALDTLVEIFLQGISKATP